MVHTRATDIPLVDFDSEIDRTFHKNFRESSVRRENRPRTETAKQTLRQLTAPTLAQQPLAVQIPELCT